MVDETIPFFYFSSKPRHITTNSQYSRPGLGIYIAKNITHSLKLVGRGGVVVNKCPKCGLVYENEEKCPLCGWLINVPFKPDKPIQFSVPQMKCPQCGKEMEHGTLQITNDYLIPGYDVRWFQKDEKIGQGLGDMFFHMYSTRKPGAICRECSLVILHWEDLARPKEPIPDMPLK
jgi:hypothetical protein